MADRPCATTSLPRTSKAKANPPSRKRAKTSHHAEITQKKPLMKQPRTGRLSQCMNMPMDILMEIFGHLHPLDLLHLSRTTKGFRRVLMHRSSISAWKAARANIPGFPDCPPEMSEPQWANLAFDAHCNICFKANIRNVDWMLRTRLCAYCAKKHITSWADVSEAVAHDLVVSLVPNRTNKRGFREFLEQDYIHLRQQYLAIEDPEARVAFVSERQKIVRAIRTHGILCDEWANAQARDRSGELDRLRTTRYQTIVDKLTALGWGDEIEMIPQYDSLANHRLVKTPQLVTERIWNNISASLVLYMEQMKTKRLRRELQELKAKRKLCALNYLQAYKTAMAPHTVVMPEPLDFFAFEPFKEILEKPTDVEVDVDSFSHLLPDVHGMVQTWREKITGKFVKRVRSCLRPLYPKQDSEDDNTKRPALSDKAVRRRMELAKTAYKCADCTGDADLFFDFTYLPGALAEVFTELPLHSRAPQSKPLWFPRVLGHRCTTKPSGPRMNAGRATYMQNARWRRRRWTCGSIGIDEDASKVAEGVVTACGMDPEKATAEDMDELDARLECVRCFLDDDGESRSVFGWRSAVKHEREFHWRQTQCAWRKLCPEEEDMARLQEHMWVLALPRTMQPSNQVVWLCLHCLDLPSEQPWKLLEDVENHVKDRHDIVDPKVNHDYVKDFAAPEIYRTKILFETSIVPLD